jgi:DDE superfamily endonuclease
VQNACIGLSSQKHLFFEKVWWPDKWNRKSISLTTDIFLASVDGVHFRISEPRHPTLSKNPGFYSHKFNQAAVCYEIGVSLYQNRIVWAHRPFPAGKSDLGIFRDSGLKETVPEGKRLAGDNGYKGEKAIVSTPNVCMMIQH